MVVKAGHVNQGELPRERLAFMPPVGRRTGRGSSQSLQSSEEAP